MKALVLTKNNFEVREIKGELEDLQNIVGGYIEVPFLSNAFTENGIEENAKYPVDFSVVDNNFFRFFI